MPGNGAVFASLDVRFTGPEATPGDDNPSPNNGDRLPEKGPDMAAYTPLSPLHARNQLARASRRRESSVTLSRARGELVLANVLKLLDQAVAAGAVLDQDQADYLDSHVRTRFDIQAEVV